MLFTKFFPFASFYQVDMNILFYPMQRLSLVRSQPLKSARVIPDYAKFLQYSHFAFSLLF